jgi:Ras-related GTP-binding protein A/B
MDLVREPRLSTFQRKKQELQDASVDAVISVLGTSIYDESLYKVHFLSPVAPDKVLMVILLTQAWSNIVHTLIPNAAILTRHLETFAGACNATEVILFERTTFLVIASSSPTPSSLDTSLELEGTSGVSKLDSKRYERTSELIKAFKHSCSRVREEFRSLEMELHDFTAVLDEMTRNTYVMVIIHDPTIGTSS